MTEKESETKPIPIVTIEVKVGRCCEICGEKTDGLERHIYRNCNDVLHIHIMEERKK